VSAGPGRGYREVCARVLGAGERMSQWGQAVEWKYGGGGGGMGKRGFGKWSYQGAARASNINGNALYMIVPSPSSYYIPLPSQPGLISTGAPPPPSAAACTPPLDPNPHHRHPLTWPCGMHQTPQRRQTPPARDHPPCRLTRGGHPRGTGALRSAPAAAAGRKRQTGREGGGGERRRGEGAHVNQMYVCTYLWCLTGCSAWQQLQGWGWGGGGAGACCRLQGRVLAIASCSSWCCWCCCCPGSTPGAVGSDHVLRACPGELLWWLGCGCPGGAAAAAGWAPAAAGRTGSMLHAAHGIHCPPPAPTSLPANGRHAALCRHLQLHLPCVCCWPLPCSQRPAACDRNSL
jgi:hypothetical protein